MACRCAGVSVAMARWMSTDEPSAAGTALSRPRRRRYAPAAAGSPGLIDGRVDRYLAHPRLRHVELAHDVPARERAGVRVLRQVMGVLQRGDEQRDGTQHRVVPPVIAVVERPT